MSRKGQTWLLLSLVVVAGAFLRFRVLGVRSLWPAECWSVLLVQQPWPRFLSALWWGEANMTSYYVLLRAWVHLGDTEVWLQSLSVLFGVITIPAVYALGKRFLNGNVGLIAGALLAVHSFHIAHSAQLRSYSLVTLLVVLSTYAFLAVLASPERRGLWVLYVLVSTLALYGQTLAMLVLIGQWLALGPGGIKRLGVAKVASAGGAIGILVVPMVDVAIRTNHGQMGWVPRPSVAGIVEVGRGIVGGEVLGAPASAGSILLSALYVSAWILAVWGPFRARRHGPEGPTTGTTVAVLAWWLVFPIVAMLGISFLQPILYPRYVLMCVPAAVLLAAQGLVTLGRSVPRGRVMASAALVAMIALALVGTQRYDASLETSGDDWRGVTKYILAHDEPGDAVIFYNLSGGWAYDYYAERDRETGGTGPVPPVVFPRSERFRSRDPRRFLRAEPFDPAGIENLTAPYRRVWLVLHQTIPTAQTNAQTEILRGTMRTRFRLLEEAEFPGSPPYSHEDGAIHLALYASAADVGH